MPAAFAGAPGMLAVGDLAGEITVYSLQDPAGPRVTARLREARSSISQVNFSEDGGRLFASTYEGLVWVWRLDGSDPELELRLEPGAQAVQGVAELDGSVVMSLRDGRSLRWPLPSDDDASLCGAFGRYLTEDEWFQLVHGVGYVRGCP